MTDRHYTPFDRLVMIGDNALRTVFGHPAAGRANPAAGIPQDLESESDRRRSAALMRVNHAGEVCAQALYQGQALTARDPRVRGVLEQAAAEENDHLDWCATRLDELDTNRSVLNPLWYAGSFAIGALSGLLGDRWSLGFLAETEHQVVRHLDGHLQRLPANDVRSRLILEQMRDDEGRHATTAISSGGKELAEPIKKLMTLASRIMTSTAERL